MATLTYTNSRGQSVVMGDSPPLLVTGIEGLGGVHNDIQRQKAPGQDGFTAIGSTLQARELVVEGVILDSDVYRYRRRLLQAFVPRQSGTLRFERGQVVREIECVPELAPAFPSDYSKRHQLFVLTLLCPSPFWLDNYTVSEEIVTWIGGMTFPWVLPSRFAMKGPKIINIINRGDVETPVRIEFRGPATNPRVANRATGEFIQINRELLPGDVLIITTDFGAKRVEINGQNVFNWIDIDSSFWQLQVGDNVIEYSSDDPVESAAVTISYRNRYVGV